MPISPNDQTHRFVIRLWNAIQHGLTKFAKYREIHYGTILALEDISGAVTLASQIDELFSVEQKGIIERDVDIIVVFGSLLDDMVVANIWKLYSDWYDTVPYHLRFSNDEGNWVPQALTPPA